MHPLTHDIKTVFTLSTRIRMVKFQNLKLEISVKIIHLENIPQNLSSSCIIKILELLEIVIEDAS